MKRLFQLLASATFILAASNGALAVDIDAGPIWNDGDAKQKCPAVCSGLEWNGNWKTTIPDKMSVCSCDLPSSGGYFKLTTQFRERSNECLEGNQVNGSRNGASFMDRCQNVSGQSWKATSAGNGYFKLTTQFRESQNECLEGNQVGGSRNAAAFMDKCQNVSGQLWKVMPAGNGYFKLTTQFRERQNECLEGNQVNGSMNGAAFMDKCQNVSGQLWKLVK